MVAFIGLLVTIMAAPGPANANVWFARAGAAGDGTHASNPIGSSAALDAATKPGDIIVLLRREQPFDGGIALKKGQTLMGLSEGSHKPSITNSKGDQHGGHGVVLADDCKILNVRIERTKACAVFGLDVSGAHLLGVDVEEANQSATSTAIATNLLGSVPHGGMVFVTTKAGRVVENQVHQSTVMNATGLGIGSFALGGGKSRLVVRQTRAERGAAVPPFIDMGVVVLADGLASEASLEMADTTVGGRLGEQGRNVLIFACAQAKAAARIERSTLGAVGQDGLAAIIAHVPATVEVEISDSTIEKAGQMNIEGSILNVPPSDLARAGESVVSIDVKRCVIQDVGAVDGFRGDAQNIWMGPTVFDRGPFAKGLYRLSLTDSMVRKAYQTGIRLGNEGKEFGIALDESRYEVRLRDNTIMDNGQSEITISAAAAHVDARRNHWGRSEGITDKRIRLLEAAKRSQLDASEPLARPKETSKK